MGDIDMDKSWVVSSIIRDNETWNTCPKCLRDWKDETRTPGLLHRTRICASCLKKRGKSTNVTTGERTNI